MPRLGVQEVAVGAVDDAILVQVAEVVVLQAEIVEAEKDAHYFKDLHHDARDGEQSAHDETAEAPVVPG